MVVNVWSSDFLSHVTLYGSQCMSHVTLYGSQCMSHVTLYGSQCMSHVTLYTHHVISYISTVVYLAHRIYVHSTGSVVNVTVCRSVCVPPRDHPKRCKVLAVQFIEAVYANTVNGRNLSGLPP